MRVIVIDDHPMFREAIADAVSRLDEAVEVWQADSGENGLRLARENGEPDLVLLDLALPGMDGVATAAAFNAAFPTVPLVIVTGEESDARCLQALHAGAIGLVPKSLAARELVAALKKILSGGSYVPERLRQREDAHAPPPRRDGGAAQVELSASLAEFTPRQIEVLVLMARGLPNKSIAQQLDLTDKTVKAHLTRIFRLLGVVNRTQAVLAAQRRGLVAGREALEGCA